MKKKVLLLTLILLFATALFVGCNMENGKVGDKDNDNVPMVTSSSESVVEEISSDIDEMLDDDKATTRENSTEMITDKDKDKD